jgi:hypothetical protein
MVADDASLDNERCDSGLDGTGRAEQMSNHDFVELMASFFA